MEGRLIDKSDILSSGKRYSKVRLPLVGADLIGFIYKGWDYPFQPEMSHSNLRVNHVGRYAPNKYYRDLVTINYETKSHNLQWKFKLDDYVSGGVLDIWQLQIDVDNAIAVFGKGNVTEIFRYVLANGKEISLSAS